MNKEYASKIAYYSEKGRLGKTPQAIEFALRNGYNFATNQNRPREDVQSIIGEDNFLQIAPNEKFPQMPDDFNIIFDLAGELTGYENSIVSALEQAEIIVIPTVNERDSINSTALAISELGTLDTITKNIIVIANMIRKPTDLKQIKEKLKGKIDDNIPIIPVRYGAGFEYIFTEKCSIQELIKNDKRHKHHYQSLCKDLDNLFSYFIK